MQREDTDVLLLAKGKDLLGALQIARGQHPPFLSGKVGELRKPLFGRKKGFHRSAEMLQNTAERDWANSIDGSKPYPVPKLRHFLSLSFYPRCVHISHIKTDAATAALSDSLPGVMGRMIF